MAQETIGLGSTDNDGTGDDLKTAGGKINSNFTELYAADGTLQTNIDAKAATSVLASTSNGEGAALIGVEDSGANFTGADVEAVLAELQSNVDAVGAPEGSAVLSTGEAGGTKFLREDGDGTSSWQTISGGGDALVANPLSQFSATTSAQLAGVLSDETGSGAAVFATSPTLVTPALGTPSAVVLTNATGLPLASGVTGQLPLANIAGKSGSDASLITGTAGTDGQIGVFNADGDLVGAAGTDVNAYDGLLGFDGAGNAVEVDTQVKLEARISDLSYVDTSGTPVANDFARFTDADTIEGRSYAEARTDLGLVIGTDVQAFDADILKADTTDTLTVGYNSSDHDAGTKTTGTFTPDPADSNFQYAVNNGAHTLAPPGSSCCIVVHYTNDSSAGAITTSGFGIVTGDAFTTTDTHEFICHLTRVNSTTALHVTAMQ